MGFSVIASVGLGGDEPCYAVKRRDAYYAVTRHTGFVY
jgi:hypothetical protein